jgi:serine protease Do/serine protease DegQ
MLRQWVVGRVLPGLAIALLVWPAVPLSARAPLFDETRGVLTLAPMLEHVTPAVVNIAVVVRSAADENPLLRDPFFRKFFGLPDQGASPSPLRQERALAAGSG